MYSSTLTECLAEVIASGDVNFATDDKRMTALHWLAAGRYGRRIGEILLAAGADPTKKDEQNRIPLQLACKSGNNGLIQIMLAGLVDNKLRLESMRSILPQCLLDCLTRIHYWKNNFDDDDRKSIVELVAVIKKLQLPEAGLVIHSYFRVMKKRDLNQYFEKRQQAVVRWLISNFDLDQTDGEGKTPLHLAVDFDFQDFIVWLIAQGARVDIKDRQGDPAIRLMDNGHSFILFKGRSSSFYHYLILRKSELAPEILHYLNNQIALTKWPEEWEEIL